MLLCPTASLMLIIHCGRLKKPLCCSALKFSTLEVQPQYKLAKYAWQSSRSVGGQIYAMLQLGVMQTFYTAGILGYSMSKKQDRRFTNVQ